MSYKAYAWVQAEASAAKRERRKGDSWTYRGWFIYDFVSYYIIQEHSLRRVHPGPDEGKRYQTVAEAEAAIDRRTMTREEMLKEIAARRSEQQFLRILKNILFGGDHVSPSPGSQTWAILNASEDAIKSAFLRTTEINTPE